MSQHPLTRCQLLAAASHSLFPPRSDRSRRARARCPADGTGPRARNRRELLCHGLRGDDSKPVTGSKGGSTLEAIHLSLHTVPANNQEFRQWPAVRKAAAIALLADHPTLTSLNLVGCEITDAVRRSQSASVPREHIVHAHTHATRAELSHSRYHGQRAPSSHMSNVSLMSHTCLMSHT